MFSDSSSELRYVKAEATEKIDINPVDPHNEIRTNGHRFKRWFRENLFQGDILISFGQDLMLLLLELFVNHLRNPCVENFPCE